MKSIVVLGATGYTGARIARALVARKADVILAARNRQSLETLAAELQGSIPIRVIESLERIDAVLDGAGVVVNTIGPFQKYGLPVAAAAIAHDMHYVDISGEQAYLRSLVALLDGPARARWVSVLPAQSYEYTMGQTGSAALVEQFGIPDRIDIFYRTGGGISHGTAQSTLGIISEKQFALRDGRLATIPRQWTPTAVQFPGEARTHSAIPFPGGECIFVPRSLPGVKNLSDYLVLPRNAAQAAAGMLATGPILRGALHVPGVRAVLDRGVTAMLEPGEAAQAGAKFAVLVRGSYGARSSFCLIRGQDVYGTTARIAAFIADWLAQGKSHARGVLATNQVVDWQTFRDALAPFGITYELGTL